MALITPDNHGDNDDELAALSSSHRLVFGKTFFEHRACHTANWILTGQQCTSNHIDYIMISGKFKSCLLQMRTKRSNDVWLKRYRYLMIFYLPLLIASASFNSGKKSLNSRFQRSFLSDVNEVVGNSWRGLTVGIWKQKLLITITGLQTKRKSSRPSLTVSPRNCSLHALPMSLRSCFFHLPVDPGNPKSFPKSGKRGWSS